MKVEERGLPRRIFSIVMFILLVTSMLTLVFKIQSVKAEGGTIYIRADGSIDPPTATISSADNITYTLTDNIHVDADAGESGIVIMRDNIIIDGDGYTLQGSGNFDSNGINLGGRSNVTIQNIEIRTFGNSIYLTNSNDNKIVGNNITANSALAIWFDSSSNYNSISGNNIKNNGYGIAIAATAPPPPMLGNIISGNNITDNGGYGILLQGASLGSNVSGNSITNNGAGIVFDTSPDNSISGNNITANNGYGMYLFSGSNNSISGNDIAGNSGDGITLSYSSYNNISGNSITNNLDGIYLYGNDLVPSSNNSIALNTIAANRNYGVCLMAFSSGNTIYHNYFVNNNVQVYSFSGSVNVWDDGYPSGGNFWSDYAGTDLYSGPYQNQTGSDGIGDTPYTIDVDNVDHYPLMGHWEPMVLDEWPMFHHDLTHTGYSTSTGPTTNQTLWTFTGVHGSPAVVGGVVYVCSMNDYALNATTGAKIWYFSEAFNSHSCPVVAGGFVYVCSDYDLVYALNATTGVMVWECPGENTYISSPAVADGVVYVSSAGGKVYALNATTGAQIWNYTTGSAVYSSPAIADGIVYVGSGDHNVYALNATTGAQIWNYTTGDAVWSSPAVADGVVYVGSVDDKVYALNAATGALVWSYTTGSEVWSSPAVADGVVYVGSYDNKTYALNATTGAKIWNYTTGSAVVSSPAVAGGLVYVGSDDGKVYALDAMTGAFVWSYTTGNAVFSSPAVAGGVVYVGSDDGKLYAFGAGVHDVAVTDVAPFKTVVGQGYNLNINVTVENQGAFAETFNVTVYANTTVINQTQITLTSRNATAVTFTWNTTDFAYGNYTTSIYVWPVLNETNMADNNLTGGTVEVTIPGDINGDGKVDILDAITLSNAFLATPSSSNWNPNADINSDNAVNILDAIILSNNFLQHYP